MANRETINIVLGTANLGDENSWWGGSDTHVLEVFSLLKKYGHSKLDSAQAYAGSEAKLGALQAGAEHDFVIDTKWRGGWATEMNTNKAENIVATGKGSLQKLSVASVDVFYVHALIYDVPLEETLSGVNAAYEAGMFRRFGLSNYPPADVQRVYDASKANNFVLPSVYQVKESFMEELEEWARVADEEGVSKAELAYRWIVFDSALKSEHGDGVVIGASNLTQLEQTLIACGKGPLSQQAVRKIEGIWDMVKTEAHVDNYQAIFGASR